MIQLIFSKSNLKPQNIATLNIADAADHEAILESLKQKTSSSKESPSSEKEKPGRIFNRNLSLSKSGKLAEGLGFMTQPG